MEPGRGIEELLRFFSTFRDRHADTALELVLIGPAALKIPKRPDIRVASPDSPRERLDAVGGAVAAVIPERLAAFSTTAAEPFSLGVPILVNASATELAAECRASGGGLYYQNYDEFELILELGLRDPSLFPRMGAAGREFLESRHDWDSVLARYDRAFRSFARPSRGAAGPAPAVKAVRPLEQPAVPSPAAPAETAAPDAAGEDSTETAVPPEPGEPEPEAAAESPEEAAEEAVAELAPAEAPEFSEPDGAGEEEETDSGEDSDLPSFFRGSIRD